MAYMIGNQCLRCGECEWICDYDAILLKDRYYVIDSERCTECIDDYPSPRCASICPVDCCIPDPRGKETREQLLRKKAALST